MAEDLEKQTRQRLRDEEVLDRDRQKNRDEIARLQSNQAAVDNDEVPVEKISEKTHRIVVEVQEKPKKAPKAKFRLIQVGTQAWPVDEWDLDPKLQSVLVTTAAAFPARPSAHYAVFTDEILAGPDVLAIVKRLPPFSIIYASTTVDPEIADFLRQKAAFFVPGAGHALFQTIVDNFFMGQRGIHSGVTEALDIAETFTGSVERRGRFQMTLSGDFGPTLQQVVTWHPISVEKFETVLAGMNGIFLDAGDKKVYLEGDQRGDVYWEWHVEFIQPDGKLVQFVIPMTESLQEHVFPDVHPFYSFQMSLWISGQGEVDFNRVIVRRSRSTYGTLLPGDEKQMTSTGDEVLSYFNPGDLKPPLLVSFTGSRLYGDGFEMMSVYGRHKLPYLLFTDSRTQGGAFMVGTPEYEQLVIDKIREKLQWLGFDEHDVVFQGYSMGSFPALYYARHFKPQGIIVSKAIVNLGTFSGQDGFAHGGTKDWPLDMRRHLFGRVLRADTPVIDQKLWQSMDQVDWTQVATYVFSLAQDEYDGQSLPQLLRFIKDRGGSVEHFWLDGDHLAHTDEMINFVEGKLELLIKRRRATL
ncbi:accessory Sec system protein Asp2 [Weissella cibaria]|uniref:accessory Sec system protein Asp2 n=1 Tax=Weissella cibaria TaxID=137591 RepID=UPI0021AFCD94|nr:accessory Sec system protein Asp2 [Weissella cibaria]